MTDEMKSIVWVGPESTIPNYGTATEGEVKLLPINMANSFIEQGLAFDEIEIETEEISDE